MEMTNQKKVFTKEQIKLVKHSARTLKAALENSKDPLAHEFLNGELGEILDRVLTKEIDSAFEDIPYFELMTRDCLPDIEDLYFDFYSLAKYGKPAFEKKD